MSNRKSYEESCRVLQDLEWLDPGELPPLPGRPPRHDDEGPLGVSFFRTRLADERLEDLTLPRTFIGRSEVRTVSFARSNLSESVACWNDLIDVDFTEANLSSCDLRASVFERVSFAGAKLRGADLRHASFTDCEFSSADLSGAKLTQVAAILLHLSGEQVAQIDWQRDDGPEPEGG